MYRDERIAYENMYAEMIELRARIYASLGWVIKLYWYFKENRFF